VSLYYLVLVEVFANSALKIILAFIAFASKKIIYALFVDLSILNNYFLLILLPTSI